MSRDEPLTRRQLLVLSSSAGIGGLAGCGGQSPAPTKTNQTEPNPTTNPHSKTTTDTGTSDSNVINFNGGDRTDFQQALTDLGNTPGSTLTIEQGSYQFEARNREPGGAHFELLEANDVTIEGNGATLVFSHPLTGGIHFGGGSNITIRNLSVDYSPPPFTQGEIEELSNDKRTLRIRLEEGFPSLSHDMFTAARHIAGSVHSSDGSFISGIQQRGGIFFRFDSFTQVGDRLFEVSLRSNQTTRGLAVGRRFLIGVRNAKGLKFTGTTDLLLEDITLRTAPGMGISGNRCSNPVLRDCVVAPAPDSKRYIGPIADGIHFSHCQTGPAIRDCHVQSIRDDAIVVNAEIMPIREVTGARTVKLSDDGKMPLEKGDTLQVMGPTGDLKDALPPVSNVEYRESRPRPWMPQWPSTVTFETPIDGLVSSGDFLSNANYANDNFLISKTTVTDCVANSIRLAAKNGEVINNELDGAGFHAVGMICSTEENSKPQRWTDRVLIRGNRITRSGMTYFAGETPAALYSTYRPAEDVSNLGHPHNRIEIGNNHIRNGAYLGILIEDAKNVSLRGNVLNDLNKLRFRDNGGFGFGFLNSRDIGVTKNALAGSGTSLYQFGWKEDSERISSSGNSLSIDRTNRTPRIIQWTPIRLRFDEVEKPPNSHRSIAFRCTELGLLGSTNDFIESIQIGGREMAVKFGAGVYSVDTDGEDSWRWMGGAEKEANVYFSELAIEEAGTLQIRGRPIDSGITATLYRSGEKIDEVTFESPQSDRTYQLSLG